MKNSFTSNLDAVRAAAKAHSTQLASAAAIPPAPAVLAPAQEPKQAAKEAIAEATATKLQQFNVRLSAAAKTRLQASARAAHMSDQEFLELLALSLPEPVPMPAPKLPWQQ